MEVEVLVIMVSRIIRDVDRIHPFLSKFQNVFKAGNASCVQVSVLKLVKVRGRLSVF